MNKIYATEFCERLSTSLNGLAGTSLFKATSKPRTATIHRAEDWEGLTLSLASTKHFNSAVAMGMFVRLLAMFGFNVYQTMNSKSKHYVLLIPSEDGRYPGFLLSSRYDQNGDSVCMSVRAQLLSDDPRRNILGEVGGNLYFCSKSGNVANELFQIPNLGVRE